MVWELAICFGQGEHFGYCYYEGKGGVLDQGDHLIGDGRKDSLKYLRQDDAKEGLCLGIA